MGRAPRIYETSREHETLIVAAVSLFGVLIALPAALVLTGEFSHGLLPVPVAHGARVIAVAEALLGLGLVLRNERARRVFVCLACAGIVYFGVEVVKEHTASHTSAASANQIAQQGAVAGEQGGPTAAIRTPEEGGTALIELVSLAIPVIFLTRPVVRRVFH